MTEALTPLQSYVLEMWQAPEGPFDRPGSPLNPTYPHTGHPINLLRQPRADFGAVLAGETRGRVITYVGDASLEHQMRLEAGLQGLRGAAVEKLSADTGLLGKLRVALLRALGQVEFAGDFGVAVTDARSDLRARLHAVTQMVVTRQAIANEALLYGRTPEGVVTSYLYGLEAYFERCRPLPKGVNPTAASLEQLVLEMARGPQSPFAVPGAAGLDPHPLGHPVDLLRDRVAFLERYRGNQGPMLTFLERSVRHQVQLYGAAEVAGLPALAARNEQMRLAMVQVEELGRLREGAMAEFRAATPTADLANLRHRLLKTTRLGTCLASIANEALLFGETAFEVGARYLQGVASFLARHPGASALSVALVAGIALYHVNREAA